VLETIGQLKRDSTFMSSRMAGKDVRMHDHNAGSDSEEEDGDAGDYMSIHKGRGNVGLDIDDLAMVANKQTEDKLIAREQKKFQAKISGISAKGLSRSGSSSALHASDDDMSSIGGNSVSGTERSGGGVGGGAVFSNFDNGVSSSCAL
jgi:hypothetical protein